VSRENRTDFVFV